MHREAAPGCTLLRMVPRPGLDLVSYCVALVPPPPPHTHILDWCRLLTGIADRMSKEITALAPSAMKIKVGQGVWLKRGCGGCGCGFRSETSAVVGLGG